MVAATVHPLPGRSTLKAPPAEAGPALPPKLESAAGVPPPKPSTVRKSKPRAEIDGIEPRRHHRIAKERDPIGGRLDLHGMTQDRARSVLEGFLRRAWDDGSRAVLIITGKGVQGDGILRRHTPEWLAAPHLAHIVAGISEAHRRHGGEGALYVALKRKPRG
jgi:DNA-nicking Smr family endonuclease